MAKYGKSKKNVYEPKGFKPTESVSERTDYGVASHKTKGGPQKEVKPKPQTKTKTVDTSKPTKRVETAFEKRQNQLKQAAKDAKGDKDLKPKKKKTATQLSREFVEKKKEKIALDKQTDALVAEKESGRRLPKHLQKQKKVTAKKRVYPDPNKKPKPIVSTKKRVYPEPKKTVPVKKTDRAISKSANVEAPDKKTKTVKVPERKTYGPNVPSKKRTYEPNVPSKTTAEKVSDAAGKSDTIPSKTVQAAKAETGSAAKMSDRPKGRRKRHVAEDKAAFGISKGGTKEDPSKGFRFNLFGKNKTKAEADKAMSESYAAEQEDRKKESRKDHYKYGEGRRSKLKQTAKKGGTIKAKTGGAIKRTYNTGGTIRFKSGGAVVDTYDY